MSASTTTGTTTATAIVPADVPFDAVATDPVGVVDDVNGVLVVVAKFALKLLLVDKTARSELSYTIRTP
jgi:hypothetical protein